MEFRRVLFRSIRKSPAFAGLPFAGRQWTLHPAFQLLPVELAVVVVVDGVELGGQRGVRLRFAAADAAVAVAVHRGEVDLVVARSEEHTSELQSLMRISYAVFCLKKNKNIKK